jgi:hypothetical protein
MSRATLVVLFRLTPDLLARRGRGLVVALLLLFFPAAVQLAVMASAWATANPTPKRRGRSDAECLAGIWAWLQPRLVAATRWLLAAALPAAQRGAWLLLVLPGLALLEVWTGLRLLALVLVVCLGGFLVEVLSQQARRPAGTTRCQPPFLRPEIGRAHAVLV